MVPGVLVVGSLPESDAEAGGAEGRGGAAAARRRSSAACSRPGCRHRATRPTRSSAAACSSRSTPTARRRATRRSRPSTTSTSKNAAEFPPEAKEARYLELLRLSYPIHPGAVRSAVEGLGEPRRNSSARAACCASWRTSSACCGTRRSRDPLIMPAACRSRTSGCAPACSIRSTPASPRWSTARSTATARCRRGWRRTRRGASPRRGRRRGPLGRCSCARRRWSGQPNAGLTGQGLRLACAEPGDQLAIFGEALRELTERATYLYEEAGRYWFSTQPTLNRLADDRAKALPDHEVDAAIVARPARRCRDQGRLPPRVRRARRSDRDRRGARRCRW